MTLTSLIGQDTSFLSHSVLYKTPFSIIFWKEKQHFLVLFQDTTDQSKLKGMLYSQPQVKKQDHLFSLTKKKTALYSQKYGWQNISSTLGHLFFDSPGNEAILVVDASILWRYLIRGYTAGRTWQKIISHHWLLTVTWMIEKAVERSVLCGS